jgi:hypothetical protein
MITLQSLNPKSHALEAWQLKNLMSHCGKLIVFEQNYGKELLVTSGVRSMDEHKAIYQRINDNRLSKGWEPIPIPVGSNHLKCLATDFEDRDRSIYDFCLMNVNLLEKIGIYVESGDYTPTWCHLQTVAPKSGARFFRPY